MTPHPVNYLSARGFRETSPEALNEALRVVLDSMEPMLYGDATKELTAGEQAVLRAGGLALEPEPGPDPLAKTAVKYAAIVKRSLSSEAAGRRLGLTPGRIRQLISDRSLYSFLIGRNRHIPDFQFQDNRLAPNIARVNKALPPGMHPVEAYNWYHLPNADLFLDGDVDTTVSPLDWLKAGQDVEQVVFLAGRLETPWPSSRTHPT